MLLANYHVTFTLAFFINSHEIIEKELTVQVTSKRSCACYSRLFGTNWAYVDHVQTQALLLPPLPTPICLQSLTRDIKGAGVGRGRVVISCLLCSDRILPRLWSIKYVSYLCHIWWVTLLWWEHPCWSPRAKDVPASQQQRSLEGGGGYKREEMKLDGGGGGRAGKRMCYVWKTTTLRKNSQAVAFGPYPHFFFVWLQF